MNRFPRSALVLAIVSLLAPLPAVAAEWIPLFDGESLEGWTVKIAGHPLGENYRDTFRVEDGILKVSYDDYEAFEGRFGHLYTNNPYSHYVLRLEYRFTGEVMPGAPSYAARNSGVMVHAQSPLSLSLDQGFPVSVEGQFLAVGTSAGRQTGNVCTPGTHLEFEGALTRDHIIEASSRLSPMEEWVQFEIEVHGHDLIIHRVDGEEVLRYRHPVLDEEDPDARRLLEAGVPRELGMGHIALQAEAQPVWFRRIMIRPLDN